MVQTPKAIADRNTIDSIKFDVLGDIILMNCVNPHLVVFQVYRGEKIKIF